jgi:hypothetical protein
VSLPCASFFCPRFPLDHPPRTPYRFKARMKFAGVAPTALGLASELFPAFARWANFCRASGVDLREAVRFTPASGRSMLRPYRTLLRQGASGSRKREQAPALHRSAARLRSECSGSPPLSRTSAYGTLAATEPFEDTS